MCTGAEAAPVAEAVAKGAAESALAGGAAEVGAGALGAEAAGAGLAGGLAAPETVGAFLSGVPEAVAGTQLPVGGALLDITAPGAVEAATAAGAALGPGSGAPSLLPGAAEAGAGAVPGGGAAPGVPEAPVTSAPKPAPIGPQTAIGTPAPGPTPVSSATSPAVSGAPVGGGGPAVPGGGTPGVPAPVTDLSTAASAADKARMAGTTSIADKAIGAITKNPLTAGALGMNVMAQANAQKQGKTLAGQLKTAAKPASSVADKLLAEGLSGKPSASSAFEIDKWASDQGAAIKQRYANMGRDPMNDSAAAKELSDIAAKAVAMKDVAARGLVDQGLAAANIAQGPTTSAALAAAQQDKDLAASMGATLQSLALLQAIQSRATV